MGLALSRTCPRTGIACHYWRITKFSVPGKAESASVVLGGFVSKSESDAGKAPLVTVPFSWSGASNPITKGILESGNAYAAAYEAIKEPIPGWNGEPNVNPFVDASDVL